MDLEKLKDEINKLALQLSKAQLSYPEAVKRAVTTILGKLGYVDWSSNQHGDTVMYEDIPGDATSLKVLVGDKTLIKLKFYQEVYDDIQEKTLLKLFEGEGDLGMISNAKRLKVYLTATEVPLLLRDIKMDEINDSDIEFLYSISLDAFNKEKMVEKLYSGKVVSDFKAKIGNLLNLITEDNTDKLFELLEIDNNNLTSAQLFNQIKEIKDDYMMLSLEKEIEPFTDLNDVYKQFVKQVLSYLRPEFGSLNVDFKENQSYLACLYEGKSNQWFLRCTVNKKNIKLNFFALDEDGAEIKDEAYINDLSELHEYKDKIISCLKIRTEK